MLNLAELAPSHIDLRFDFSQNQVVPIWTLYIPAGICKYWKNGPCTMCPLPVYQRELSGGIVLPWSELGPAVENEWKRIICKLPAEARPQVVRIFHGGNFIVPEEVNPESQIELVRLLSNFPSVRTIAVESKPEYVSKNRLKPLVKVLKAGTVLQVNMGFEVYDHSIRERLNKGFSDEDYIRTTKVLRSLGVKSFVYLIIQPPGVSPREAVNSIVESVKWTTNLDPSTETSLLALFVENGTIALKAYERGEFEPPTFATVVQALIAAQKIHPQKRVSFGGFRDLLEPVACAHGCKICGEPLEKALNQFKIDCNIERLKSEFANIGQCDCLK